MLFHDIGKPECFTRDESGEGHFYGHAQVSAGIADSVLRRLRASTALREQVCGIVRYHDIPLPENDRQFRRMLSKHGEELSRDIAMAHIADDMAKKPECLPRCEDWRRLIARIPEMAQESCLSVKSLAVDGRALSGIVPPSPLMGKVLKFLLDGVMDGKFPNEREFLLQEAAKYIANRQKT
jgi:tRNA nucleotidyltransferase (CCA-adding enzyme)